MRHRRRVPTGWLGGLGCGALLMFDPATALLLLVLLAPSLLMRICDDKPERSSARAVMFCNVAAVIGPLIVLWQNGAPTIGRALDLLANLRMIAWAWLAGSLGWLLSEALILAAARWLAHRDARARSRIADEMKQLTEEWGTPP